TPPQLLCLAWHASGGGSPPDSGSLHVCANRQELTAAVQVLRPDSPLSSDRKTAAKAGASTHWIMPIRDHATWPVGMRTCAGASEEAQSFRINSRPVPLSRSGCRRGRELSFCSQANELLFDLGQIRTSIDGANACLRLSKVHLSLT